MGDPALNRPTVAPPGEMPHLDVVPPPQPPQPPHAAGTGTGPAAPQPPVPPSPPGAWGAPSPVDREVRKARERADRAARRADRAQQRVYEAEARSSGRTGVEQLVDAAGDVATAALTAVSAAAEEANARLAAKARQRELEQALVTARAGGTIDIGLPTREESLKLADRVEPGSTSASIVKGLGLIAGGIAAAGMILVGGFGWLGFVVPMVCIIAGNSLAERLQAAERSQKAGRIQLELARASVRAGQGERSSTALWAAEDAPATAATADPPRLRLVEDGDPRTRAEVVATLDRLIARVDGHVDADDRASLLRIREAASHALPGGDQPLDLSNHETWLTRQICIDYLPLALEHYIALPADLASEPVLEGRSARQVLDEQLALIEGRLDEMATREYRREAGGLLNHARFVADSLKRDPFQQRLAELATADAEPARVADPVPAVTAVPAVIAMPAPAAEPATARERELELERERERA